MSESLNHLCPSAPGKGNRGAASCLFRLEQFFFFFTTYLKELLKPWVLGVGGLWLFPRSVIPTAPSFLPEKGNGFIQTGKWTGLVFIHLVWRLRSELVGSLQLADRAALCQESAFPSLFCSSSSLHFSFSPLFPSFPPGLDFRTMLG